MEFLPNEVNRDIVVSRFADRLKIYLLHSFFLPLRRIADLESAVPLGHLVI